LQRKEVLFLYRLPRAVHHVLLAARLSELSDGDLLRLPEEDHPFIHFIGDSPLEIAPVDEEEVRVEEARVVLHQLVAVRSQLEAVKSER